MRRANSLAFTLIEILIVVAILGIAATIAVPVVASGQDGVRIPAAARMIMSDMLLAQSTAITTQQRTMVYFINDEAGVLGYTVIRFPVGSTPTAPTLAQAIAGTPPVTGSAYIQTTNARRGFYVNLGTQAPGGTGPMAQARLSVASLTNFGFDSLGAPVDASGAQLTSRILLTVANSRGTFSRQLEIAPLTGEINVP